ncbi:MAG TPA: formate dehydrogenase accessory sulfurtransferase FdhD [Anaerolineae bacterium]|nr:formate dehydrogenase accessory sulfurtransferase FdhD [Anaerolineae bacterium]HOQ99208.1 formate dehydrogenase accessory sulfurtransferase FdhD [Anaerolineae bacterium]
MAQRSVRLVSKNGVASAQVLLPGEVPLAIEIGQRQVAVLMRTPGDEKALALGYCLSEGLIASLEDVRVLHHCGSGDDEELLPGEPGPYGAGNRVRLQLTPEAEARLAPAAAARWVFSGCGGVDAAALGEELRLASDGVHVAPETLFALVPAMARVQRAYREAGGIHAAGVFDAAGRPLAICEDVGRHNAADKAIGAALLAGQLPAAAILAATGRASSDIVAKAARAGIPIAASFSSSTSLGIELAEAAGITLAGYLRRNRFTLYTHPQRIAGA